MQAEELDTHHKALKDPQTGDATWSEMVPSQVAELIQQRRFFGCR